MLIVPTRRLGALVGGLLVFVTLLLDLFWVWQMFTWPITFLTFVQSVLVLFSLPWLGLLIYWLYGLFTLTYHLDRNRLFIRWGWTWQSIPLAAIERLEVGMRLVAPWRYRGARWPGYWAGHGEGEGIGRVFFFATAPLTRQVVLVTPAVSYAISPADPDSFLREFQLRRDMGPTQLVGHSSHRPTLTGAFWTDRLARGLLFAGLVMVAALFGHLCWRYPSLSQYLALHFDAFGQIDRIGQRHELFALPVIGLFVLVANLFLGFILYRRERVGACLIWGSTVAVHVLLWLALLQLTG